MHDDLWAGVEFKLAEAQFFLERMGKVLVPPQPTHPSMMALARWQPDFYYYLDAFIAATRSVPDVIQKCFGCDPKSSKVWHVQPDAEEITRRQQFQAEFRLLYLAFNQQVLSRVRTGTLHWVGLPSVQTKANALCGREFTGGPLQRIPDMAVQEMPAGADTTLAIFSKPTPVRPSWQDFTLEIPQRDGSNQSLPLFDECRSYAQAATELMKKAKEICARVHGDSKMTAPPAVTPEKKRGSTDG